MAWKWWFGVGRSPTPLLPHTFLNINYYLCKSPAQVAYRTHHCYTSGFRTIPEIVTKPCTGTQNFIQHICTAHFFPIFLSLCEILSPLRAPTASLGFDSPYLSLHSWMKASLGRRWCPDQKKAEFLSSNFYPSPKKTGIFGSIKALQIYVGFVTSAEKIKVISLQVLTHFQTKINKLISINKKILQAL